MKFFFNNYKNNSLQLLNGKLSLIPRYNSTSAIAVKLNTWSMEDYKTPKINLKRNQSRLVNISKTILAYIETQTQLPESIHSALVKFLGIQELHFFKDPAQFVVSQKLLANWLKVNVGKMTRTQDKIPNADWSSNAQCPTVLADVLRAINSTQNQSFQLVAIRILLSILEMYQVTLVPSAPSINTITDESQATETSIDQINVALCLQMLGIDLDQIRQNFDSANATAELHSSSAAGPNGQALWMSHIDAKAVWYDENVKANFEAFCKLVNREDLFSNLENSVKLPQFFKLNSGPAIHSKLHFIFEKGNKCRTIAIIDWWTQEVMNPLHNTIADILRNFENDGTFDQNRIAEQVRVMTANPNSELYSLDLTAATDRLPISLQVKILDELFGKSGLGIAWKNLAVDRDFDILGKMKVRYAVGQPMGMKSSFPMLGLTHHIIVMQAAISAGFTTFKDYVILGDDIVINNSKVGLAYQEIMKSLGLEIQLTKSIISTPETSRYTIAEICRRVFVRGMEISPLPVKLIANCVENGDMFYQLQDEMFKRDLVYMRDNFRYFAASIINIQSDIERLAILNSLPKIMTGMSSTAVILTDAKFDVNNWKEMMKISVPTLLAFFTFTVCVEQLKRLSNIVQNTQSTYETIMKAANVAKVTTIGITEQQYVPVEDFTEDDLESWDVVEAFHPATEVVKSEVARISMIMVQLSAAQGKGLIEKLLSSVIDSLKISAAEVLIDKAFTNAKVTRKLIDGTLQNIKTAQNRDNQTLSYSVKLMPFNIIWTLKVSIDGECTISRSASKISTTMKDAQRKLSLFNNNKSTLDIFGN